MIENVFGFLVDHRIFSVITVSLIFNRWSVCVSTMFRVFVRYKNNNTVDISFNLDFFSHFVHSNRREREQCGTDWTYCEIDL